ncbi:conjugal transfer protein TrbL [Jiangella endophytica]|uniref:conjugal transfer protein TrbL n=1 Tax=Jiangella endophytica TaxID=1623398 RepID=UPI000E35005F|nr:conjugal transfer protein TrbL [Jiangella endophytica]
MSICDVPVIAEVCNLGGEAAGALVAAPFNWLAQAVGGAAAWMFESVWAIFDTTTLVDLTSEQYVAVYNVVFGVAIFVMLIFFFLQVVSGLIRREPGALQRAVLGLAKSVLGSFVVITLTAMLLEIVDQLCVGIVHATGTTMEEMGERIAAMALGLTAINVAAPGVGAILTIVLGGMAVAGAAIVWGTLLIRKALLLVAIVVAPLALSGASWDATRGWIGRWATFVLALIVSKLIIVLVFLVATAQVSSPLDFDLASIADPIAGIVLMFIAAFAPYMTYRFISFMGIDLHHAVSAEQESKAAVGRPAPMSAQQLGGLETVVGGPAAAGGAGRSGGAPGPGAATATTARPAGASAAMVPPASATAAAGAALSKAGPAAQAEQADGGEGAAAGKAPRSHGGSEPAAAGPERTDQTEPPSGHRDRAAPADGPHEKAPDSGPEPSRPGADPTPSSTTSLPAPDQAPPAQPPTPTPQTPPVRPEPKPSDGGAQNGG